MLHDKVGDGLGILGERTGPNQAMRLERSGKEAHEVAIALSRLVCGRYIFQSKRIAKALNVSVVSARAEDVETGAGF